MKFRSLLFLFVVCASTAESGVFDDSLMPEMSNTLEIVALFPSEDSILMFPSFLIEVLLRCYPHARNCSASQADP